MSTSIQSLDLHVNELIASIKDAQKLGVNELIKAKVAFQLTKINLGLRLITRVMKLYDLQEVIEDRLLTEEAIQGMSVRELLVMSSVNSKRMNDYFGKMDKILGSINLRDLEGSLLIINELTTKQQAQLGTDPSSTNLTALSLGVLEQITKMGMLRSPVVHSGSNSDRITEESVIEADTIVKNMDKISDGPTDNDIDKLLIDED